MKATIENPVNIREDLAYVGDEKYFNILAEFNLLLTRINGAENVKQLKSFLSLDKYNYFKYGFGGSHMWVKQVINGQPKQQVIFVQF